MISNNEIIKTKINYKDIIILILFSLFNATLVNINISSNVKIIIITAMTLLAITDHRYIYFLIGTVSYLPNIYNVSGLNVILFVSILVIILNFKKVEKINTNNIYIIKFVVIYSIFCLWIGICSFANYEFIILDSIIKNLLFIFIIICLYMINQDLLYENIKYLFYGIMQIVPLGLLTIFKIDGFVSNHILRLSIGVRSDPNSTAIMLTLAIIVIFILLVKINFSEIKYGSIIFVSIICLIVLLFWMMLLTASRGGILSVLITIVFFIINESYNYIKEGRLIKIQNVIICMIYIIVITSFCLFLSNIDLTNFVENIAPVLYGRIYDDIYRDKTYILAISQTFLNSKNLLIGVGYENYLSILGAMTHNTSLDFLVSSGILGFLLYIYIYVCPLLSSLKIKNNIYVKTISYGYIALLINTQSYSATNEKTIIIILIFLVIITSVQKK